MISAKVGLRIKELRKQNNISQEELALKSGLDRTYINHVENGRRNITVDTLEKVTDALSIDMKEFFDFSSIQSQYDLLYAPIPMSSLTKGSYYINRQICNIFKCSPNGGIRVSNTNKTITIITDLTGSPNNPYQDSKISPSGSFVYTGMGSRGDQVVNPTNQNGKLYYSKTNGYTIYYFVKEAQNKYVFMGKCVLNGEPYYEREKDYEGNERSVIKFPLVIL